MKLNANGRGLVEPRPIAILLDNYSLCRLCHLVMRKTPFKQSLSKCHYYWTVIKWLIRKNIHAAQTEKTSQWSNKDLPPGVAAFFNLLYVQSFGVLLWSLPDRQSVDFGRNATTITLRASYKLLVVINLWKCFDHEACVLLKALNILIWYEVSSEHVEFAPVCAEKQNTYEVLHPLEHRAFFNCITSVRLLSRAG